ncbi:MAG: PaaI family thioesterase [Acholeplasmataceae bacterium]
MIDYITKKQLNAHHCYVCGTKDEEGLHASFYELKSDRLLAVYHPKPAHGGYPEVLHGGVTSSLLDEVMARSYQINHDDPWGMTADLKVRYLKKVPMIDTLYAVGWVIEDKSRMFYAQGYITDGKTIFATSEASYMKVYVKEKLNQVGWEMVEEPNIMTQVELPR